MRKLTTPGETLKIISRYDFGFRKKFGQNFLVDEGVIVRALQAAQVGKEDVIIEIGPGIGTMTQGLCERAGKVLAIEIDGELIPILKDTLSSTPLKLSFKPVDSSTNNGALTLTKLSFFAKRCSKLSFKHLIATWVSNSDNCFIYCKYIDLIFLISTLSTFSKYEITPPYFELIVLMASSRYSILAEKTSIKSFLYCSL